MPAGLPLAPARPSSASRPLRLRTYRKIDTPVISNIHSSATNEGGFSLSSPRCTHHTHVAKSRLHPENASHLAIAMFRVGRTVGLVPVGRRDPRIMQPQAPVPKRAERIYIVSIGRLCILLTVTPFSPSRAARRCVLAAGWPFMTFELLARRCQRRKSSADAFARYVANLAASCAGLPAHQARRAVGSHLGGGGKPAIRIVYNLATVRRGASTACGGPRRCRSAIMSLPACRRQPLSSPPGEAIYLVLCRF